MQPAMPALDVVSAPNPIGALLLKSAALGKWDTPALTILLGYRLSHDMGCET
jgi:hypothetical protein